MEITDEHELRALDLITPKLDGANAYRGYLAAVERIKREPGTSDIIAGTTRRMAIDAWRDGAVSLSTAGFQVLTPGEAREVAFEILVASDLAEGESGT